MSGPQLSWKWALPTDPGRLLERQEGGLTREGVGAGGSDISYPQATHTSLRPTRGVPATSQEGIRFIAEA